ncbi:hypothetical protein [Persicirhabdus sediminis]|uniref:Uncharacterized protein n=1 Tax=Persicirhabdus sediminis TaxID=454144 RepID=A0A8J7SIK0_9BACT|nr:hypothetical protein [Persicirhabdus sediminis]MBK1790664.1 hypothetical protein [Persicirhabdus sediminis]
MPVVSQNRSVHRPKPFIKTARLCVTQYLFATAAITLLVYTLAFPSPATAIIALVCMVLFFAFWLLSNISSRSATCPLCRGKCLASSKASKHKKAYRLKPLSYAQTTALSIVFTNKWRCMHCGSVYDLKKKPGQRPQY